MSGEIRREHVAVLGGGPAAMAAAFELTATRALRERFAVTVYQPGWRLGGKCASGRNLSSHARIEEHGLHLWFGFYDNAFKLMRSTYEALNESTELRRPPSHPLATFEKAFVGGDELVLYDRQDGGWESFAFRWPTYDQTPGGDYPLPDVWEIACRGCEWAVAQWDALIGGARGRAAGRHSRPRLSPGWLLDVARGLAIGVGIEAERGGENLLHLAHHLTRAYSTASRLTRHGPRFPGVAKLELAAELSAAHVVAAVLARFRDWMWDYVVAERQGDARLRLFFTMFDTFASAMAGVAADGVLEHGWNVINDRDLCEWLSAHGAKGSNRPGSSAASTTRSCRSSVCGPGPANRSGSSSRKVRGCEGSRSTSSATPTLSAVIRSPCAAERTSTRWCWASRWARRRISALRSQSAISRSSACSPPQ